MMAALRPSPSPLTLTLVLVACITAVIAVRQAVVSEEPEEGLPRVSRHDTDIVAVVPRWSSWSHCAATCGPSMQIRYRVARRPGETKESGRQTNTPRFDWGTRWCPNLPCPGECPPFCAAHEEPDVEKYVEREADDGVEEEDNSVEEDNDTVDDELDPDQGLQEGERLDYDADDDDDDDEEEEEEEDDDEESDNNTKNYASDYEEGAVYDDDDDDDDDAGDMEEDGADDDIESLGSFMKNEDSNENYEDQAIKDKGASNEREIDMIAEMAGGRAVKREIGDQDDRSADLLHTFPTPLSDNANLASATEEDPVHASTTPLSDHANIASVTEEDSVHASSTPLSDHANIASVTEEDPVHASSTPLSDHANIASVTEEDPVHASSSVDDTVTPSYLTVTDNTDTFSVPSTRGHPKPDVLDFSLDGIEGKGFTRVIASGGVMETGDLDQFGLCLPDHYLNSSTDQKPQYYYPQGMNWSILAFSVVAMGGALVRVLCHGPSDGNTEATNNSVSTAYEGAGEPVVFLKKVIRKQKTVKTVAQATAPLRRSSRRK